jgi:hypothetical protein
VTEESDADFEDVLCWSGWWDCPRFGVALIAGVPHFFDCQFSDELEDYPDEYQIWPASEAELADELEVFGRFAAWRRRFDAGEVTGPHYGDDGLAAQRVRERRKRNLRSDLRVAVPEWKLDRNRKYTATSPRHRVRWYFRS